MGSAPIGITGQGLSTIVIRAAEPLERAADLVFVGCHARAEGEIDLAVAVDVVCLDADVVVFGRVLDDRVFLPPGIGEPDDRVLGHRDDVGCRRR